jgi:hypothetical protein
MDTAVYPVQGIQDEDGRVHVVLFPMDASNTIDLRSLNRSSCIWYTPGDVVAREDEVPPQEDYR